MPQHLTDLQLLHELDPVVEKLSTGTCRWSRSGIRTITSRVGRPQLLRARRPGLGPEQSQLSEVAQVAMVHNLLTEDNLPSYHREIAMNFGMDGAWGHWVNRWTAEENRHGIVMRDYLVVTRAVDPVELERLRVEHMTGGLQPRPNRTATCSREPVRLASSTSRSRSWPPGCRTATPARSPTRRSPSRCWPASRPTRTCT